MGKIRLNDNTELDLISIDNGMQEEQECLNIYLKDTKSVEEYDSIFSDKEKTKKISVIGDEGEVLKVHNDFTTLKECGKVYGIVIEANTEKPAVGNAVFVMLYRQSDLEKRVEEVEKKLEQGGSNPELQAAAMVAAQFSAQALPDELALEAKAIYPAWDGNGVKYSKDHKVLYKDVFLKRINPGFVSGTNTLFPYRKIFPIFFQLIFFRELRILLFDVRNSKIHSIQNFLQICQDSRYKLLL